MVLPPERRTAPTGALVATRIAYAFNWYHVGAVLPLIGSTFVVGTAALGVVLGSFLVGVGLFQIPAGIASVRWGPRRVSLIGVAILGGAGVASAFSPTWPVLAATRFVGGVGAAFFFSPALSLVASYFPAGERGPIIGLYNGGFSVGGAAGLFGGAALGALFGWRWTLLFGGVALLGSTLGAWILLPAGADPPIPSRPEETWRTVRSVLGSRSVWALSLGLTGFWAAIYIVAQYFVDFGERAHSGWPAGLAAGLAAMVVLVSFPGGPLGGWLGDRTRDRRGLLVVFGGLTGLLVLALPYLAPVPLAVDMAVLGLADGIVFAVLYLVPTDLPETEGQGLALGVAVVNSLQVGLGSGIAIAFGAIVAAQGYAAGWCFAGLLTLGLLPLLVAVRLGSPRARDDGPSRP